MFLWQGGVHSDPWKEGEKLPSLCDIYFGSFSPGPPILEIFLGTAWFDLSSRPFKVYVSGVLWGTGADGRLSPTLIQTR